MENTTLTNVEIAKMFLDVMLRTSANHHILLEQKRLIEKWPESLAEAFAKNGKLEGFYIRRFHTKYYPVLESILRDGVNKTAETQVKQDIAKQRNQQFAGIPGSASAHVKPESSLPSWDDGIKRLES